MDIGNNGHAEALLELLNELHRLHIGHGGSDYLAARLLKLNGLTDAALNIGGGAIEHRLHSYLGVAADIYIADLDFFSFSSFHKGSSFD